MPPVERAVALSLNVDVNAVRRAGSGHTSASAVWLPSLGCAAWGWTTISATDGTTST